MPQNKDFYTSDVELLKIPSEMLEPFASQMIGRWYHRCTQALEVKKSIEKKLKDEGREPTFHEHLDMEQFYNECSNLWWGVKSLTKLSIACRNATHFCIALQNEKSKIANWIKKHLGFDPILDKDKGFGF
jgi:hypothetical protein